MAKKRYLLPAADDVKATLAMLMGEETKVVEVEDLPETDFVARFVCPRNLSVAHCVCDLPFASYAACALSMMNADAANEFIDAQALSDEARGNLREVMNICTTLFMDASTDHLKLISVETGTFWLDRRFENKVHFEVDIPSFGKGRLSFSHV